MVRQHCLLSTITLQALLKTSLRSTISANKEEPGAFLARTSAIQSAATECSSLHSEEWATPASHTGFGGAAIASLLLYASSVSYSSLVVSTKHGLRLAPSSAHTMGKVTEYPSLFRAFAQSLDFGTMASTLAVKPTLNPMSLRRGMLTRMKLPNGRTKFNRRGC
jgi:hypothetical protein